MPVTLHGAVYTDSDSINDNAELTFKNSSTCLHLKLNDISQLIIKSRYEDRYNIIYKDNVYSIYKGEQLYNDISCLFEHTNS